LHDRHAGAALLFDPDSSLSVVPKSPQAERAVPGPTRRGTVHRPRKLGTLVDRTRKEFTDADIEKITRTYHAWRGEADAGVYEDVPGFCKSATLEEIKGHGYVLTPGRYVGAADIEDDDVPFDERFLALKEKLKTQLAEAERLSAVISGQLARTCPNE